MGAGSSGGGGAKSSTPGAGTSAGGATVGTAATAPAATTATPAAGSGLGAAQQTPVSAIQPAGGIQSGATPVSGIQRPGAQEIINQLSPTTTPESSQAVTPSARDVVTSEQAANVGGNPAQGAFNAIVNYFTGGLLNARQDNTQSALPSAPMTGAAGQRVAVPQSAPGITAVQPVGAVGASPRQPGVLSRAGGAVRGAGSSILENLGITPENRQQLFQDAIVQLAQQGKGNVTQSELPQTGGGGREKSLAEIMAELGIRGMQNGGTSRPGEPVVVGESGPEIVQGQPGGQATVTPLRQLAQFPAEQSPGVGQRIIEGLQDALIFAAGLQNPTIFVNARAAAAEQERKLAEMGLKAPVLLETSPGVARAAVRQVGQPAAEAVLRQPDIEERRRFEAAGVVPPAEQPGAVLTPQQRAQAVEQARARGASVRVGAKGIELEFPAIQKKDVDSAQMWARFHGLVTGGMPPVRAAQTMIGEAEQTGKLVPDKIIEISAADSDRELKRLLAEAEAEVRAEVEERTAAGIQTEREIGTRLGRLAVPLTKDEIAAKKAENVQQARREVRAAMESGQAPTEGTDVGASVRARVAQLNAPLEQQEFFASELGGPVQPTPEAARTQIAHIDQGQRALDRLLRVVDPQFIGFAAGRKGTIKEFFGKTGKGEAALRSEIRSLRRAYRLAQTGQQASDAELQRLYGELINENMGVTQFVESLRVIGREIGDKYDSQASVLLANNERVPALTKSARIDALLGEQAQEQPSPQQGAPAPTPRTSQPAPQGRVTPQQAAREVGATLQGLLAELDAAVKAGEITPERATAIYNRAEAAGALPAQ